MNRMSYTYSTYIYAYDADTKIRVLINPDGTKLAVATDITRALGYQSNSQAMRSNSCLTRNATIQIFAVGC